MTLTTAHLPASRRDDSGAALVVAMISLVVVTGLATTLLTMVDSERVGVVLESDRLQAVKLAEGALEIAEVTFVDHIAAYRPLPDPPVDDPFRVLDGVFLAGDRSIAWTVRNATSIDEAGKEEDLPGSTRLDAATGLQITVDSYVLEAEVGVGTSRVRMRRHIELQRIPIFQFLAYYAGDLEILPGPAMVLNGRIHTNADLYMAAGASLSISTKYVKTASEFHRHRKDTGASAAGWIKIQDAASGDLVTLPSQTDLAVQGIDSEFGLDSAFTGWDFDGDGNFDQDGEMPPFKNAVTDLFGGTLQSGEHGVKPLQPPDVGAIQAYVPEDGGDYVEDAPGSFVAVAAGTGTHSKSYFHSNADLVVIDDQVFNRQGQNITASMPSGFVQTRNVWDQRENRAVPCTQINVGKLGDMDGDPATFDPCPHYPANGLLFASRSSTVGGSGGVVLTNGKELNVPSRWNVDNYSLPPVNLGGATPGAAASVGRTLDALLPGAPPTGATAFGNAQTMGLSVVSPVPVYVHGDYNTIAKKPAAVISDAVNLLSNAWDFTKTSGVVKTASDTTYNFAMISGHVGTDGTQYSGGFENLPRFHENWSGKNCTIKGSFVSTWFSQLADSPWVYGGAYYSAPNRNWSYDTMFDQGRLPPFTPMVVAARHVAWEVRN